MDADFLSCDWGTTSFRLRWVSGAERKVIREIREPAGIKALHAEAAHNGEDSSGRSNVFDRFLSAKLGALVAGDTPPGTLPLVISGMASSSIGWRELPYAKAPFPLDGRGLRSEQLVWQNPTWVGPTWLISGIANETDMMRGEETEIIGLMSDPGLAELRQRSLLILPGTHSKHVWIENEAVVDFRTFMTGELFEVLGRHSVLRASVDLHQRAEGGRPLSESDREAFQEGVRWARGNGLAGLFRVRTRAVLERRSLANNTWFFSGLLIGAEICSTRESAGNSPVILAASREVSELYHRALELTADAAMEWVRLPPEQVERATVAAHALFLRNQATQAK
jgi:2-dehydro-3-deoxygalactonokinase